MQGPHSRAEPPQALLQALLRRHGMRSTRWRCEVLRVLWQAASPMSHQDLTDALGDSQVDRATVYRNLMALSEADLVQRIDLGDHVWRFELRKRDRETIDEHAHFLCTECGRVVCLESGGLRIPRMDETFVGQVTDIVVRGLCQACA